MSDPFTRKDTKEKKVKQWAFQVETYFESQTINMDVDRCKLVQFLLKDHAFEWWTTQKDVEPNLTRSLPWNTFKAKLNERFTSHN
jgi:hypothetical protein